MKKSYVTIKTVAKELNMSVSTISRVINDKPDVSEETKKIVLNKVEELGYVRNVTATMMRNKKSLTVGVIFESEFDPFFSEILQGIEKGVSKYDYRMLLMNTELRKEESKSVMNMLMEHRVDGIIIVPSSPDIAYIKPLVERKFPIVIIGRNYEEFEVDEVYTDDIHGGVMAGEYLMEKNRTRLLMINSPFSNSASQMREKGFLQAIDNSKGKIHYRIINTKETDYKSTTHIIDSLYPKEKGIEIPYDGIFCFNDMRAFAVINALRKKKINIPSEVSVVGYDNIFFSSIFSPELTTINIDKEKEGYEAMKMLVQKIRGNRKRTKQKILDVALVKRET